MTTPNQQYVYVTNPSSAGGTPPGKAPKLTKQRYPAGTQVNQPSRTTGPMSGSKAGQGQQSGSGRTGAPARQSIGQRAAQVNVPKGVPVILGNRQVIFFAWIVAMILVGFDEWHNYHLLPRPARFWYTSLTFGLLIMASFADAMVPLANAFAIGFVVVLLWQYYEGSGQFSQTSGGATG